MPMSTASTSTSTSPNTSLSDQASLTTNAQHPHLQLPPSPPLLFPSAHHESTELLQTLTHIRTQLHRASHLYAQKAAFVDDSERQWIESTIADTADAVHALAVLVEPVRVEWEVRNQPTSHHNVKGRSKRMSMGLGTQLRWVCRDGQRAKVQRSRLMVCYSSLMVVLERLMGVGCDDGGKGVVGRGGGEVLGIEEVEVQELPGEGEAVGIGAGACTGGEASSGVNAMKGGGLGLDVKNEMRDLLRWRQAKGNNI
ncbi:uncharacterized protein BO87DRAFT_369238 [Aspergillus neoniger CBS 115656]|uniref:Uncharacterized protein n=1 Tax=Aspergillus neoniger (strain CBS 115656) TaxID=1448310 RepID=A0A318YAJ3_ASPNB|nr:hypothetical protein BO87DRAFT_369238 [Aspergillus neoniger CBS 115656]PYH29343.1 hypothetical protein BO87DRAFT_369238 [Aspergillus neoniger CBS 115656]